MTDVESQKLVAMLFALFPGQTHRLTPDLARQTAAAYRRMLADLDYGSATAALERVAATSEFFPTVAAIRAAVVSVNDGDVRQGAAGWGDVLSAVSRWGINRTPGADFHFDDPIVQKCVNDFGWQNICNSENQVADRARFIDHYDRIAKDNRTSRVVGELPANARLRELRSGEANQIGGVVKQLADRMGGTK